MMNTGLEQGEATARPADSLGVSRPRVRYPHHQPTGRPGVGSGSGSPSQLPAESGVPGHYVVAGGRRSVRPRMGASAATTRHTTPQTRSTSLIGPTVCTASVPASWSMAVAPKATATPPMATSAVSVTPEATAAWAGGTTSWVPTLAYAQPSPRHTPTREKAGRYTYHDSGAVITSTPVPPTASAKASTRSGGILSSRPASCPAMAAPMAMARKATAERDGLRPRTSCRYSVAPKMITQYALLAT